VTWVDGYLVRDSHVVTGCADFASKRMVSASLPRPPLTTRRQSCPDRSAATICELNEDHNIEPETGRDSVEPHFAVVFEHDAGANRDGRAIPEQPSSVGSVADLLPLTPCGCAVVVD